MTTGRRRILLAVALLLAVAGSATVEVRRRQPARDPADVAASRRTTGSEDPSGRADDDSSADGVADDGADDGEGAGGLFDRFLDALGGGDGSGGSTTELLENCTAALAGVPVGSAGFLPKRDRNETGPADQVQEIVEGLQELRMLRFEDVPEPVFVSSDEMSRRVEAEVKASLSPEDTANEARGLIALGALPAGADLLTLTLKALSEQVAGYYDPDSGELVVTSKAASGRLDAQSRIVLAHELDHALTDQVIGLPDDEDGPPGTEDVVLARLALVEGDATLAMQLYGLAHVPLLDQLGGLGEAAGSQEQLAELPYHVQQNLLFPYLGGLSFVCALHDEGGWAAVDAAYKAPPASTAQVLFPERYLAREEPADPRDLPAPPGDWRALPRRALGAAELQWLLEAPGGDTGKGIDHARRRVAGWAGGELQVWVDGDRTATGVALVQHAGAPSLCTTMAAWYTAAFPPGKEVARMTGEELAVDGTRQDAVIRCAGSEVRIGIGPDLATARSVTG